MKRDDYLTLCKKVSMIKGESNGIRQVPENLLVSYNGILYYPVSYVLFWTNGEIKHSAVLHDLKTNSTVQCRLKDVKYENL